MRRDTHALLVAWLALLVAATLVFFPSKHQVSVPAQLSAGQWALDEESAQLGACCRQVYTYERVIKVADDGHGHVLVTLRLASGDAPRHRFTMLVELGRAPYQILSDTVISN